MRLRRKTRFSKKDLLQMLANKDAMLADAWRRAQHGTYPRHDALGNITIIGPECFTDERATVITYKGENYYTAHGLAELAPIEPSE